MNRRLPAVAVAFAVGLVVGAVGGAGLGGLPFDSEPGPDPESPPVSVSRTGADCLDVRTHAGWVHEVAVGDSHAVTLNATVIHERGRTVTANVSRATTGVYRIDLVTAPDANQTGSSPDGCTVATDLRLGTSLPTDYREFEVSVDGRTLLTVENDGTVGELYRLPNPVNASE